MIYFLRSFESPVPGNKKLTDSTSSLAWALGLLSIYISNDIKWVGFYLNRLDSKGKYN